MAASYERLTSNERGTELRYRNGSDSIEVVFSTTGTLSPSMRGSDPRPGDTLSVAGETRRYHIYDRTQVLNQELLNSITENQLDEVHRILCEGGSVNATCTLTHTSAVHLASMEGHSELLGMLFDRGAVSDRYDLAGRSPLHLATRFGHADCARVLVARCPRILDARVGEGGEGVVAGWRDCDLHDHEELQDRLPVLDPGSTPLHVASQFAHLPCVELLLQAGADVNTADELGLTPFDVLGEHLLPDQDQGHTRSPQHLLPGQDQGHTRSSQHSNRFLGVVQVLTAAQAAPGLGSSDLMSSRHTPLHAAVRLRSADAISLLRKAGYSILCRDKTRSYPVHLAVSEQRGPELEALVCAYGQPVTALVNDQGFTPLHMAVMAGWLQGIMILLNAGADVTTKTTKDSPGYESETVLHLAAKSAHSSALRLLLQAPRISEVMDEPNAEGQPPLFHAVCGRSIDCVRLLLVANADTTKTDNKHRTVLHWAVEYNLPEVVSELFEHRPDAMERIRDAACTWGVLQGTALHLAAYVGDARCVKILIERGCEARKTMRLFERAGCSALHVAAQSGHLEAIKTLLFADRSLVHATADGATALHLSCKYGREDCVQLLIAAGSDLSAKCLMHDGKTRTAMELLMHRLRSPVHVLREAFDSSIGYAPQTDKYVDVDYTILLPDRTRTQATISPIPELDQSTQPSNASRANQMKVVDALLQTGDQQDQQSLLMHPLVESFLHLQWTTLSGFYYALIVTYSVYIVSFTTMVIGIYCTHPDDRKSSLGDSTLMRVIVITTLSLLVVHELVLVLQTRLSYFLNFESWLKVSVYCLSVAVTFIEHRETKMSATSEVTSAGVLLAWLEYMFLISRVPRFGYCVLMFTKVATNLFRVLLTFVFLIVGFAVSFMVEFRLRPPFESTPEALVKTVIMMTGEFDYSGLFDEFGGGEYSRGFAKLILISFVILVSVVLMNLLVAMAVTDIKDLDTQGKIDRLRKEAEFVSMFEKIVFDNVFLSWLPSRVGAFMQHYKQVPTRVQLCVCDETKDGIHYPEKLRRTIVDMANANRESQTKVKKRELKVLESEEKKIRDEKMYNELSSRLNYLAANLETKLKNDESFYSDVVTRIEELKCKQTEIEETSSVFSSSQTLVFAGDIETQPKFSSGEIQQMKNRLYSLENDQQDMQEEISQSFKDLNHKLDVLLAHSVSQEESKLASKTAVNKGMENLIRSFELEKKEILVHQREILEHIESLVAVVENKCSD